MKIRWKIKKERGHLRPKLDYRLTLESFEIKLGVPMVMITSRIPKPPDAWQSHVYPGMGETAGWTPEEFYKLSSPSHKTGSHQEVITLPMREICDYPEVEKSFLDLREEYEKALVAAYRNAAFETGSTLDMSPATKTRIAPGIGAWKLLNSFNG